MSDTLLNAITALDLTAYSTLWVGFSGGIDSTALLHALCQLPNIKPRLRAIHINHGIQPKANNDWQRFCEATCHTLQLPLTVQCIEHGMLNSLSNVEERARNARYQAFEKKVQPNDALLLAHHQDDQAETVLLRLFRGAGIDGLSAMKSKSQRKHVTLLRPFLTLSKDAISTYAEINQLKWVNDLSNQNNAFDRNFIRNEVLPLLKTRYPGIQKNLARTASLCLESKQQLNISLKKTYTQCVNENNTFSIKKLQQHTQAEQCLLLRQWLSTFNVTMPAHAKLISFLSALNGARDDKHPLLALKAHNVQVHQQQLHFYKKLPLVPKKSTHHWPSPFLPYYCETFDALLCLTPAITTANIFIPEKAHVEVRMRQGGETIRLNGITQKVKKILQKQNMPFWQRPYVPLVYINGTLAAISNKVIADYFQQEDHNTHYLSVKPHPPSI